MHRKLRSGVIGARICWEPAIDQPGRTMDLQLDGLRVLITAGASGIGWHPRAALPAKARACYVCDVDRGALDALARSDRPDYKASATSPTAVDVAACSKR